MQTRTAGRFPGGVTHKFRVKDSLRIADLGAWIEHSRRVWKIRAIRNWDAKLFCPPDPEYAPLDPSARVGDLDLEEKRREMVQLFVN
jgi:hypothetical protein